MTDVFFKTASYEYSVLKPAVFELMENMGDTLFQKHSRVLIKPNLLMPAPPDTGISTHPLVVRAVAEYVLESGATPVISDSPAMGTFKKIRSTGGYDAALSGLDVEIRPFEATVKTDIGAPFGNIDIAADVLEADAVINLPKLKSHAQMLLTLGVKNTFGCIVGMKKPRWHMKTGVNRELFARLLVQIHAKVNPCMTLLDGILALEGDGPGKSGTPRYVGMLAGSKSAVTVDMAICHMLGKSPDILLTNTAATSLGLADDGFEIHGDFRKIKDFRIPEPTSLLFGPKRFRKLMRKHLIQRPVVNPQRCQLCGECRKYCPANAITQDKKHIWFDYDNCIRCYCCIEICPHGALQAAETLPGKLLRKLRKDFRSLKNFGSLM